LSLIAAGTGARGAVRFGALPVSVCSDWRNGIPGQRPHLATTSLGASGALLGLVGAMLGRDYQNVAACTWRDLAARAAYQPRWFILFCAWLFRNGSGQPPRTSRVLAVGFGIGKVVCRSSADEQERGGGAPDVLGWLAGTVVVCQFRVHGAALPGYAAVGAGPIFTHCDHEIAGTENSLAHSRHGVKTDSLPWTHTRSFVVSFAHSEGKNFGENCCRLIRRELPCAGIDLNSFDHFRETDQRTGQRAHRLAHAFLSDDPRRAHRSR